MITYHAYLPTIATATAQQVTCISSPNAAPPGVFQSSLAPMDLTRFVCLMSAALCTAVGPDPSSDPRCGAERLVYV